jgi:4-hydroxybutyrate CoA-transferase
MPRTHGNTLFPIKQLEAFIHTDRPLHVHPPRAPTPVEDAVGEHAARLVPDGATLQMGIGGIPDAVLRRLFDKSDLGVHTEMFSDGVVDLVEAGVITNRRKHLPRAASSRASSLAPSVSTGSSMTTRSWNSIPAITQTIQLASAGMMMSSQSIQRWRSTGRARSARTRLGSGFTQESAAMDFIRGSALSRGGKAIIALPSTAARGTVSRIVPALKPGAGVVTTRGHVHWVITEYGAVNLFGLSLRRRAEALISIAHPDVRDQLRRDFAAARHIVLSP